MAKLLDVVVKWIELEHEKMSKTAKLRAQLADIQAQIQALELPIEKQQGKLEEVISTAVIAAGGVSEAGINGIDEVKIVYRSESVRRNWDMDQLDALKDEKPAIWKVIKSYRGETPVKSSFSIKLK